MSPDDQAWIKNHVEKVVFRLATKVLISFAAGLGLGLLSILMF